MASCGGGPFTPVADGYLENGAEVEDDDEWGRIYSKLNNDVKPKTKPIPSQEKEYVIGGVQVNFPYVAYKSQKQLMAKAIEGVKKSENCLLESPTGTGKTAALLCSLLGWQRYCQKKDLTAKVFADKAAQAAEKCTCGFMPDPEKVVGRPTIEKYKSSSFGNRFRLVVTFCEDDLPSDEAVVVATENHQSQASPPKIVKRDPNTSATITRKRDKDQLCRYCTMSHFAKHRIPKIFYSTRTHSQVQQVVDQLKGTPYRNARMTILASRKMACINTKVIKAAKKYEERFQKGNSSSSPSPNKRGATTTAVDPGQGSQLNSSVIDENDAQRTLDDSCRMLRKNYFWNLKQREACECDPGAKEFEPAPVCDFFQPIDVLRDKFGHSLADGAWDIEDLKSAGKDCDGCPYYGSQSLYEDAQIVFCPYNYIISPSIRAAVGIDLIGNIIVFDEAHNLEDICRDEASMNLIDLNRLDGRIRRDLDSALRKAGTGIKTPKKAAVEHFSMLLQRLSTWMRNSAPQFKEPNIYVPPSLPQDGPPHLVFKEDLMLKVFDDIGLGKKDMSNNSIHLAALTDADELDNNNDVDISLSSTQQPIPLLQTQDTVIGATVKFEVPSDVSRFITKLLATFRYMYEDENYKHYNTVLVNYGVPLTHWAKEPSSSPQVVDINKPTPAPRRQYNISLEIICLSPALVFKTIRNQAHSIIVTSGTLSPLDSFAGELNTPFNVKLVAQHVVETYQTFSCSVMSGVNKKFEFIKKGQGDVEIQDDLGQTLVKICQTVPHGVLVFLPSYTLMDTLRERWSRSQCSGTNTSILKQLENSKNIFFEERKDKEVFERDMQKYKDLINHPIQNSSQTGCLLFAIFRGKVSEGINFTDDQARAVVTVGIPFPNFGAYPIKYKREYNDARRRNVLSSTLAQQADLLGGDEWYNIQGFRAMNQAFGRCVRHKNDWGAIIMLESRMSQSRNQDKLSNWVKSEMRVFESFEEMKPGLINFTRDRVNNVTIPRIPIPSTSTAINIKKNDNLDTSIESIDMDMEISDDDEFLATSRTQLTQVTNNLKLVNTKTRYNSLSVNTHVNRNNIPSYSGPDVDLDSSSYSLDESDCFDYEGAAHFSGKNSCSRQPISVHDLPTQIIPQNISDDDEHDISYTYSNNSSSSNDIIEGTP